MTEQVVNGNTPKISESCEIKEDEKEDVVSAVSMQSGVSVSSSASNTKFSERYEGWTLQKMKDVEKDNVYDVKIASFFQKQHQGRIYESIYDIIAFFNDTNYSNILYIFFEDKIHVKNNTVHLYDQRVTNWKPYTLEELCTRIFDPEFNFSSYLISKENYLINVIAQCEDKTKEPAWKKEYEKEKQIFENHLKTGVDQLTVQFNETWRKKEQEIVQFYVNKMVQCSYLAPSEKQQAVNAINQEKQFYLSGLMKDYNQSKITFDIEVNQSIMQERFKFCSELDQKYAQKKKCAEIESRHINSEKIIALKEKYEIYKKSFTATIRMLTTHAHIKSLVNHVAKSAQSTYSSKIQFDMTLNMIAIPGNNVLCLQTLKVLPRLKEHLFTKSNEVEYTEERNLTEQQKEDIKFVLEFLASMFMEEHLPYDQRVETNCFLLMIGHSLTGQKIEGRIINIIGDGSNGKSTLVQLLQNAFPAYIQEVCKDVLVYNGTKPPPRGGPNPALAQIEDSCRLAIVSETDEEDKLIEHIVKCATGQEKIYTRDMYKSGGSKEQIFTFLVQSNNQPLSSSSFAITKRQIIFRLDRQFVDTPNPKNKYHAKRDTTLIKKFKEKAIVEAAFHIFVKAAYEYNMNYALHGPLKIPDVILDRTKKILDSLDCTPEFFESQILPERPVNTKDVIPCEEYAETGSETDFNTIYLRYKKFCKHNGMEDDRIPKIKTFGTKMRQKFGEPRKSNSKYIYPIKLRKEE